METTGPHVTSAGSEIACSARLYFLALPINQKTRTITPTTAKMPTQTPALKISPITWQPGTMKRSKAKRMMELNCVFITDLFTVVN